MKTKIDWMDVEELAREMLGLDSDADSNQVEEALAEKLEVSFDSFHRIVEMLTPLTPPARAALSGNIFHGFIKDGVFLVKAEVQPNSEVSQMHSPRSST